MILPFGDDFFVQSIIEIEGLRSDNLLELFSFRTCPKIIIIIPLGRVLPYLAFHFSSKIGEHLLHGGRFIAIIIGFNRGGIEMIVCAPLLHGEYIAQRYPELCSQYERTGGKTG